jgi:hypothetical protein
VNVYNYFFYRLYCWGSQWKNDVAPPEFNAFAIVSAVLVGHAILFVQLVELIFGFRIIALLPVTDTRGLLEVSHRNLPNYENVVKRLFGFTFT